MKTRKSQLDVITAMEHNKPTQLCKQWININRNYAFGRGKVAIGSRIDSTYEYYFKVPFQLSFHDNKDTQRILNDGYMNSIDRIFKYLAKYTDKHGLLYIQELPSGTPGQGSNQFDHLNCFLPGTMGLSSFVNYNISLDKRKELFTKAVKLLKSCVSMYYYTNTGLAPEIVYFNDGDKSRNDFEIHSLDRHNLLRPETVESIFYLWRITNNNKYRKYGFNIFRSFKKYTKTDNGGYGSINDVTVKNKNSITFRGDVMESFFMAETMKYLYLMFSENNVIDISKYVFNTEAHPFPVINQHDADQLFV